MHGGQVLYLHSSASPCDEPTNIRGLFTAMGVHQCSVDMNKHSGHKRVEDSGFKTVNSGRSRALPASQLSPDRNSHLSQHWTCERKI